MTEDQARDSIKAVEQMWNCEIVDVIAWIEALLPFDSVTVAGTILKLYEGSTGDRPELVGLVAAIKDMERAKAHVSTEPRIPTPEPVVDAERGPFVYEVPAWMKGWAVARYKHNDHRVFAEQRVGYDSHQIANPGYRTYVWPEQEKMPPEAAAAYIEEGAPLGVKEIFRMITA